MNACCPSVTKLQWFSYIPSFVPEDADYSATYVDMVSKQLFTRMNVAEELHKCCPIFQTQFAC